MDLDLKEIETFVKKIVFSAGEVLKTAQKSDINVKEKEDKSPVTQFDKKVENMFREEILKRYPDHLILGEEEGLDHKVLDFDKPLWIIDPIDGTLNFSRKIPFFSISVALFYQKEIVLGIVYNPMTDEFFSATKGNGAFLNGNKIHVSQKEAKTDILVAASFYCKPSMVERKKFLFDEMFSNLRSYRRMGSVALELAYLGAGRSEACFDNDLNIWDIAAGICIIQEAGGVIYNYKGKLHSGIENDFIAVNTKKVGQVILSILKKEDSKEKN